MELIKFKRLETNAKIPERGTTGSAGYDVFSLASVLLPPFTPTLVTLGFSIEMPEHLECQVRSRSSVAKKGIIILNSPGTIDSDYRGEVGVLLMNVTPVHQILGGGDKIAQLVFNEFVPVTFEAVDEIGDTDRGEGGFGSTGI